MIYNLAEYINNNTSLTINVNGFLSGSPDTCISVNEGSGDEQPWFNRKDTIIQFTSRAFDKTVSRANAYTIYDLLAKKYGLVLPETTVNSVTYSEVTTWGIRPVSPPQYAYDDENGRSNYTFSIEITVT